MGSPISSPKGTWSRIKPCLVFLGLAAAGGGSGCGLFDHKGWQCNQRASSFDVSEYTKIGNLRYRWSFDDENNWRASVYAPSNTAPLAFEANPSTSVLFKPALWGGIAGTAAHFDGRGGLFLEPSGADASNSLLLSLPLTYSLWVAPHERWLESDAGAHADISREMVLLSTISQQPGSRTLCGGHDISLAITTRGNGDDREHVRLTFRSCRDCDCSKPASATCCAETQTNPVPKGYLSADSWSGNKWHHVVAAISANGSSDEPRVTLYWDTQAQSTSDALPVAVQPGAALCLGAPCRLMSTTAGDFIGLIDEVAVFGESLSPMQVADLSRASHHPLRLGSADWYTKVGPRSMSSVVSDSSGGLRVTISDGASSSGGIASPLSTAHGALTLADVSLALLNADLPALSSGQSFGFNLQAHQGREYCAWYVAGVGGNQYYLGELPHLAAGECNQNAGYQYTRKWCRCDDCACSSVADEVFVYSPWLPTMADVSSVNICDVQILRSTPQDDASDELALARKPGITGPGGLCWRPIAYNPNAYAQLIEPSDGTVVSARLAGESGAGALLVADFSVLSPDDHEQHLLDASNCNFVCLRADLSGGQDYRMVLVSGNSATCEVSTSSAQTQAAGLCNSTDNSLKCYCMNLGSCPKRTDNPFQDGAIDESNWDATGNSSKVTFDPAHIRYVGIQKDWSNSQEFTAKVESILFYETQTVADAGPTGKICSPQSGMPRAHVESSPWN